MAASMTVSLASATLFLVINLAFFFSAANSCGNCPKPPPSPRPLCPPPPQVVGTCPRDVLELAACGNLLGVISVSIGTPPRAPCCTLLEGLADLEAAACLCTALQANVLGIQLNIPIKLTLLLNYCGIGVPSGFVCA